MLEREKEDGPANTAYERKARHVKQKELRKLKTEHRQQNKKT